MSVNLRPNSSSSAFLESDDFLRLLPSIRRHARHAFRNLDLESRDEAVQEVVANSFAAFQCLIKRGKSEVIAPMPLARFAVAQTRAGRHVGSQLNIHDVSSAYCQRNRGITLESLDHIDEATGAWEEILIEDPSSGPADTAAIRIDYQSWLDSLSPRQRQVAEVLSTGESTQAVAKLFDVTSGRISQFRNRLKAAWEAFQGEDPATLLATA